MGASCGGTRRALSFQGPAILLDDRRTRLFAATLSTKAGFVNAVGWLTYMTGALVRIGRRLATTILDGDKPAWFEPAMPFLGMLGVTLLSDRFRA
jgi:hypothetical protein